MPRPGTGFRGRRRRPWGAAEVTEAILREPFSRAREEPPGRQAPTGANAAAKELAEA